jgi:hypothetical protein
MVMTRDEAFGMLQQWHKRHPKEDLFTGSIPTDIGRRAIERLARYDVTPAKAAMADTELEDRYAKMPGVFGRLSAIRGGSSKEPEWMMEMRHGDIVRCKDRHDVIGCIEIRAELESLVWIVAHSGLNNTAYWAVVSPRELVKFEFEKVLLGEADNHAKSWKQNIDNKAYDGEVPECVNKAIAKRLGEIVPGENIGKDSASETVPF